MTKRIYTLIENGGINGSPFSFSNLLMRSPLRYSMMERRFLYKLSEAIKMRYEQMGLKMRENWDNLVFNMTDKDLASIGGNTHIVRTYTTIRALAQKSIIQFRYNKQNQLIIDYFHWIDAFRWNTETNDYTVRVSPELYDYVISLTKSFTVLNLHTAILLESKYSQKFYEFCCQYSGDFRFIDPSAPNVLYKKRVIKVSIKAFRFTFGLSELNDPKTGELLEKEKYRRFKTMVMKVILPAQEELYRLYQENHSDVWFDYQVGDRYGRGRNGSPKYLIFYIYTRNHPKSTNPKKNHPWKEGEEPLYPFEEQHNSSSRTLRKIKESDWLQIDEPEQRKIVYQLLLSYLNSDEVTYYMMKIDEEQARCRDSYAQVIQVIYEKLQQPKFKQGTKAYKRKCLIEFVFTKNLLNYGWSIVPNHK